MKVVASRVRNRDEEGGELLFFIISLGQLFDLKIINKYSFDKSKNEVKSRSEKKINR